MLESWRREREKNVGLSGIERGVERDRRGDVAVVVSVKFGRCKCWTVEICVVVFCDKSVLCGIVRGSFVRSWKLSQVCVC